MDPPEVADKLEIYELLGAYARAVDTKDWALYRSVFTPEATIDYIDLPCFSECRVWMAPPMKTLRGCAAPNRSLRRVTFLPCFRHAVRPRSGAERMGTAHWPLDAARHPPCRRSRVVAGAAGLDRNLGRRNDHRGLRPNA